jgi:hypothetical protein
MFVEDIQKIQLPIDSILDLRKKIVFFNPMRVSKLKCRKGFSDACVCSGYHNRNLLIEEKIA